MTIPPTAGLVEEGASMSAASDVMSTPSPEQSLCPKAFCRERAALVIVQKLTIGDVDR